MYYIKFVANDGYEFNTHGTSYSVRPFTDSNGCLVTVIRGEGTPQMRESNFEVADPSQPNDSKTRYCYCSVYFMNAEGKTIDKIVKAEAGLVGLIGQKKQGPKLREIFPVTIRYAGDHYPAEHTGRLFTKEAIMELLCDSLLSSDKKKYDDFPNAPMDRFIIRYRSSDQHGYTTFLEREAPLEWSEGLEFHVSYIAEDRLDA